MYNARDPVEIGRLRRKVRGDVQRNTGGAAKNILVYDDKLQMFLPDTLAREILRGENPEFGKFGRYLEMLKYNLRTGMSPGKRSTAPARSRVLDSGTTPGGVKTSGSFSARLEKSTSQ